MNVLMTTTKDTKTISLDLNHHLCKLNEHQNKNKMGIREELVERSGNEEMLFADGYDDAIIGYTDGGVAVYSIESIIMIMVTKEEMTHEDALDHFYYNVSGAYVGEYTPIFVHDLEWGV